MWLGPGTLAQADTQLVEFGALCAALGASSVGGPLSAAESALLTNSEFESSDSERVRQHILAGADPLGDRIIAARSAADRRTIGQVFTPATLVDEMVAWVSAQHPERVVDCGCGSGRFALAAAQASPQSQVLAVDLDPVSSLACRANAAVLGLHNVSVLNEDFVRLSLSPVTGLTAFIGNPPYVRHHHISPDLKAWARRSANELGWSRWSGLAGLHAIFFMAVVSKSAPGDVGCLLTSSEWLDVNYGRAMRDALLNGAGGRSVHILHPKARAFDDAMTTASVTCFQRGHKASSIRLQSVRTPEELRDFGRKGRPVSRSRLEAAVSWTELLAPGNRAPEGFLPLGDYIRVSRGAVTGGNDFFLLTAESAQRLGLAEYCIPAITRAREVLAADGRIRSSRVSRHLLAVSRDDVRTSQPLAGYVNGPGLGVREGYVCRSRTPWYSVPLKKPPIVATYMGRGRPAFALNPDRMPIVNVVHGLYPKVELDDDQLLGLVNFLNSGERLGSNGRIYQGGLRKYEPGEMERMLVPSPDMLRDWTGLDS